jgi:hypothetical protein
MLRGKGLLTPIQRAFIEAFAGLPDAEAFYLAGGTALAEYYLGHRLSFDLDMFTGESGLVLPLSYQVEVLSQTYGFTVAPIRRFASYVEFLISEGDASLKVELAQDTPFRFAAPLKAEPGIRVNDLLDLQVDKLLAYYGRAEPRDAVDLHFILRQEPLGRLLELAPEKDPGFDLYWFAVALNRAGEFPDELSRWPVQMIEPFDPPQLKAQFRDLAEQIMEGLTADKPDTA